MPIRRSPVHPIVTVVAAELDTLNGVTAYLEAAGIPSAPYTDITDVEKASPETLVFVLFPDAYLWEVVVLALAAIRERHSTALPVIVTSKPRRYEHLTIGERVLIVPRPAWGWSVLDGIRFHVTQARRALSPLAAAS